MAKYNLATSVLLSALTSNLDSYPAGPKGVDEFTINLIETLLAKIKDFLKDAYAEPFQGNKTERELAMITYLYPPGKVFCQFCNAHFANEYYAIEHLKTHKKIKKILGVDQPPGMASFWETGCILRSEENLPKSIKRFLSTNVDAVGEYCLIEADRVKTDDANVKVTTSLEKFAEKHFPDARCSMFGSRVAGTGNLSSDLDIYMYLHPDCNSSNQFILLKVIEYFSQLLKTETKKWMVIDTCLNARVPVLRVHNLKHDIKCDLIFSNDMAVHNTRWLEYMFQLQPQCRSLVCVLKKWNPEICLNTYTISLMVIFFFQCRNYLPSVHSLQNDLPEDQCTEGWKTGFAQPFKPGMEYKLCDESVASLAHHFFKFYSETFSLETGVVCPLLGHTAVLKKQFHEPSLETIPPEMGLLWNYMQCHACVTDFKKQFVYNAPFVVQDPFELCHNVAKGISPPKAAKYLRLFELSAEFLANTTDISCTDAKLG